LAAPSNPVLRLDLPSDEVSKAIANKKSGRGCRRERRDSRTSTVKIAPPPPHQRPQRNCWSTAHQSP
jgi:hypothetical protein